MRGEECGGAREGGERGSPWVGSGNGCGGENGFG